MGVFEIAALLIVVTALLSYANHRFVRLPTTIGVMVVSLAVSLALIGADALGFQLAELAERVLEAVEFDRALLHGMLGFLLFAGALHVNLDDLLQQKWVIATLATAGVLVSTFLVGGLTWLVANPLGVELPFLYCLLFGSLISPTDPIAVLGIMKSAGAPKSLETKISGESLFNDGVGVVLFLVLLGLATGERQADVASVAEFFAVEALGGALFGLAIGAACYLLLRTVDNYQVEVLLTLALVMGGYAAAGALHVSGPIAMVVAGLLVGNRGRRLAMSETTREHLDTFWELVDEILNAVLFVLIGFELLLVPRVPSHLLLGLLAIPLVLAARFAAVGGTVALLRLRRTFSPGAVRIMTWGGLRGGISLALALSLPTGEERAVLLSAAYVVVVFSILVQGLTVGKLVKHTA